MVFIGMAIGAALGAMSSLSGASKANKALIEALKKQQQAIITNYNYNQKQLDMQERSATTQAEAQLQELQLNSMQNNSAVVAALNETGYEGNTKNKITSSINAQSLRNEQALKDSYEMDVANIRSQKNALYIQTQNELNNAQEQTSSQLIGGLPLVMQTINGAAQGAALGYLGGVGASALSGASGLMSGATGAATTASTATTATTAGAATTATAGTTASTVASTAATTASTATTASSMTWSQALTQSFATEWAKYGQGFNSLMQFNSLWGSATSSLYRQPSRGAYY